MRYHTLRSPIIVGILRISAIFALFSCPFVLGQETTVMGVVSKADSGEPIAGASVIVSVSGTEDVVAQTTSDSEGYYEIPGLINGSYTFIFSAQGFINESKEVMIEDVPGGEDTLLLDVGLNPVLGGRGEDKTALESNPFALFYRLFFMVTIALIISLVMYSKIKRENLLKNAQRNRIYEHIKKNPGMHYRAILTDLGLTMGVLTYHLNRLEKDQYIKSRQDGMYRRFYARSTKTEMRFFLSEIQESIIRVIRENQGISQSSIANKINVSRKVVNYHVSILDQAGLVSVESRGRESACFTNELKPAALAEGA